MNPSRVVCSAVVALCVGCSPSPRPNTTAPRSEATANAEYQRFTRAFLDWYYAADPIRSTELGLHQFDRRMPDLTRAGIERETADLRRWLARLSRIDRRTLTGDAAYDYQILDHVIRGELMEVEEVRDWQKSPMLYNAIIAGALASLSS